VSETIELAAYGRVDLDGTHRAVIEADHSGLPEPDGESRFVSVTNGQTGCGCILSEVRRTRSNKIFVDRFKQWHLGIRDGDPVHVRQVRPTYASSISLRVPPDFGKRDVVRFIGKPLVQGEKTALFTFGGETRLVVVSRTAPGGLVVTTPATEISTTDSRIEEPPVSYRDIGGLEREVRRIREVVEYPIRHPGLFSHLGVSAPRGIILYGPPGTGKTLIARALANETGAHFTSISGPEVYSKWYGKSEENLRNIFSEAVRNAPSIVVIDELDALVPVREKTHGDQEQRIVATFLTQMDGLREMKDVVVVGTTNRIDAVDPALRRGGRFEYEVHIGVPDAAGRAEILEIHTRRMPLTSDVSIHDVASRAVGYVGSDLASLCREAAYNAIRRCFVHSELDGARIEDTGRLEVSQADFDSALASVPPSALKELSVETPRVAWEDVGGHEGIKRLLVENISLATSRREAFRKVGVRAAGGILLTGPPGTGKTLLARAVASECRTNFIAVTGPEIRSRWIGEAEERIRFLFAKARMVSPCVLFLDEVDAAVPARGAAGSRGMDAVVNQILAEMDGMEAGDGVCVVGATNRVQSLDPAVLRPGRFDHVVEVGLPGSGDREAIFRVHLADKPLAETVSLGPVVEAAVGLSGAEIAEVCRQAAWHALRQAEFDPERILVTQAHLSSALSAVCASRARRSLPPDGAEGPP
jgi:transitional endoplasmic reticulum ATPase